MRLIWLTFGLITLAAGILGIFLPLVPTVPFLLLAAFSFARSSDRLHHWLVTHPQFGEPIRDWQTRGVIRKGAKIAATVSIIAAFGMSLILGVRPAILLIQAFVLTLVLIFIWSRPAA